MITTTDTQYNLVYRDVIGHSVTGEAMGIEHYSQMIPLSESIDERLDLLEDAYREKAHLLGMREVAAKLGLQVKTDLNGHYWKQIRAAFRERVEAKDLLGCYMAQDIVFETFAVILYKAVAPGSPSFAADMVSEIADEESTHLAHGVHMLKALYPQDPAGMRERAEFATERVARVLAEWTKPEECVIQCGVCAESCAKLDLHLLEVDMADVQGQFLDRYGASLREIGFPVADVTRWIARVAA
jgi:fatty aldehyde decarbonylase